MSEPKELTLQIGFAIAELQRLNLQPGEFLAVKLIGNEFDETTTKSLRMALSPHFPNNKVMIFTMPSNSDILFEAIKPAETEIPKATSYCEDCTCGKKEGCGS